METSFIFSVNELFTLVSKSPSITGAGRRFVQVALSNGEYCDLGGLEAKKMVRRTNGEVEIMPIVRMIAEIISGAEASEQLESGWLIHSPWLTLYCEIYPYKDQHYIITPLREDLE